MKDPFADLEDEVLRDLVPTKGKAVTGSSDPFAGLEDEVLNGLAPANSQASQGHKLKKAPTVVEDLEHLWNIAKGVPPAVWESLKAIPGNKRQAAVGAIPAITSILDIFPMAYNATQAIPEYAVEKISGKELPEEAKSLRLPHVGEKIGTSIADMIGGAPQTDEEAYGRAGGGIVTSLLTNPKHVAQGGAKIANTTGITKAAQKIGHAAGDVAEGTTDLVKRFIPSPTRTAKRNLQANLPKDEIQDTLGRLESGRELGLHLTPGEASGSPVVQASEQMSGTSKQGALASHAHKKQQLGKQQQVIGEFLDEVHPEDVVVDQEIRSLAKNIIRNEEKALMNKAKPYYAEADNVELDPNVFAKFMGGNTKIREAVEYVLNKFPDEFKDYNANSFKVLNEAQKRLGDIAESAGRKGDKHEAGLYSRYQRELVDEMERVNPVYKKARDIYREDAPEVEKMRESVIGKIADMDDEQLKNLSSTIFDPSRTDANGFLSYKKEISKASPELWNALIRQDMTTRLSKGPLTGSRFRKNILEDPRLVKQYKEALKGNPTALKKFRLIDNAFKHLDDKDIVKSIAAQSDQLSGVPLLSVGMMKEIARKLTAGLYDRAAVNLMTNNNWDDVFKKIDTSHGYTPKVKGQIYEILDRFDKGNRLSRAAISAFKAPALQKILQNDSSQDDEGFARIRKESEQK